MVGLILGRGITKGCSTIARVVFEVVGVDSEGVSY
jgi:hypothetical protein